MARRLRRYYGAGYSHFITTKMLEQLPRHYAYDEAGPVLVNERQNAELRIRKIS